MDTHYILKKFKNSFDKNKSECLALMTAQMPKFVYGIKQFKDIPVFCFHSAHYPLFEKQLQFLSENRYITLTADELYERCTDKNYKNNGKDIVITFDDGMASVWTVAYPLLKKYEHKIISFILPGLMEEGEGVGATIDDVVSEQEKIDLSNRDFSKEPLCNWTEVKKMHKSGLVDFQSHGMYHALISTSPKIIDFIHPEFDVYHYGNIHIPVYENNCSELIRSKVLGHPVYENAPRLSAKPRYLDLPSVRLECERYVKRNGGAQFFKQPKWRSELLFFAEKHIKDFGPHEYEASEKIQAESKNEILSSKKLIEEKLNKKVEHFCFPWFVASEDAIQSVMECGYKAIYLGEINRFKHAKINSGILSVTRVQEDYINFLVMDDFSLIKLLSNRIANRFNK